MSEQTTADGNRFPESSPPKLPQRRKRVRTGSGFLLLGGFALLAGGIALETAHLYSWRAVKVGREVADLGIENGHLMLAGVFVFMLGMFARALARLGDHQAELFDASSSSLVMEQVALDLADLRGSLREVAHRSATVAEEQKVLLRNQHALLDALEAHVPDEQESHQSNNALFRLAASMDQMSARMETRIKHLDDELRKLEAPAPVALASQANHARVAAAPAHPMDLADLADLGDPRDMGRGQDQGAVLGQPTPPPSAPPASDSHPLDVAPQANAAPRASFAPPPHEEELQVTVELEEDPTLPMQPSDEFFDTVHELESAVEAAINRRAQDEAAATIDLAQAAPEALDALLPDDD